MSLVRCLNFIMVREKTRADKDLTSGLSDQNISRLSTQSFGAVETMPAAVSPTRPKNGLTKFTNCRLLKGDALVEGDLWVSSVSGKVIDSQASFYDELVLPDKIIDLGGRILSPGMIECQLNGAFGFNFSTLLDDMSEYGEKLQEVNRLMVQTGVTSYIPTITSQLPEMYQKVRFCSSSTVGLRA